MIKVSFASCYEKKPVMLMEGALGERLKREYGLLPDDTIAFANIIYRRGGKEALFQLWNQYIETAKIHCLPFIATTPTRRANMERVAKAGYDKSILLDNISALRQLREISDVEMYIGGLMGCKGDAYSSAGYLNPTEAKEFHSWQASLFAQEGVDFLFAGIMPTLPEAIGMAMAMEQTGLPYIISFMIRDNGRLLDGTPINDAIERIDGSVKRKPVCYMTNCIHPTILYEALSQDFNKTALVKQRFHGIQANTSALPPEQLDNSKDIKTSDCFELAQTMSNLNELITLKIVGGCCGTDNAHIEAIAGQFSSKD